jgi:putative ABC transport system ATP-binding protein
MSAPYVIDAENVTLSLGQRRAAPVEILRGVTLKVGAGETVALLGPSGSGKSSLMAVLSGMERPTGGQVRVAGADFTGMNEDALARARRGRIGIVLQAFHLLPTMTAQENVAVPLELAGAPDAFDRAVEELEAVGLGHRLTHYPAQLSGGEQQRVAIARALAPRPALLFADEPTGNLDAATGAAILDLLFARQIETGATLFVITHDPALAQRCARVLEMSDGRVVGDNKFLPGTGRWQPEGLTEGAHLTTSIPSAGKRAPSTTRFASGPPPRSGEDL